MHCRGDYEIDVEVIFVSRPMIIGGLRRVVALCGALVRGV